MTTHRKLNVSVALLALAALVLTACGGTDDADGSGGPSGGDGGSGGTLVVDTVFQLKTVDPGRQFERTGNTITKALYDTLVTFDGGDVTTVVPDLADFELSPDATTLTLTLDPDRTFSDGSPVTADDVVFSLQRVAGMKGNPSFLLAGVTVAKQDEQTVVLTSATPNFQLPYILASPSLSILNAETVQANGGTIDESDGAEEFLNSESAGSGPYVLESLEISSEVRMVRNPEYDGPRTPAYDTVVFRNVESPTQRINVERGDSQVAFDLTGDQVEGMGEDMTIVNGPGAIVVFLLLNQSPDISVATSDPDYMAAVRKAIDFDALLEVAGPGSVQPAGMIPTLFTGTLPEERKLTFDLEGAKAALAASPVAEETVRLSYPSDNTVFGTSMQSIAERLQSQFAAAGLNVELAPAPVATELDNYRNGNEEMGLWTWGPDYPEAADYLVFGPGGLVGLRARWEAEAAPEIAAAAEAAAAEGDPQARIPLYHEFQEQLNASGPFIPLMQPATNIVTAASVSGAVYNPIWTMDVASLGAE